MTLCTAARKSASTCIPQGRGTPFRAVVRHFTSGAKGTNDQ